MKITKSKVQKIQKVSIENTYKVVHPYYLENNLHI